MDKITKTVRSLGIARTYLGYYFLIDAVKLVLDNETLLFSVCRKLYPAVARIHHTTADNVERNLRTAIRACWEHGNRSLLESMFPYPLYARPSASEVIDALADYCKSTDSQPLRHR